MKVVSEKISLGELEKVAEQTFGDMVKGVVDVEKEIMAIGAGMHADEEKLLLEQGSKQKNLWGINIYPACGGDDMIEFDSMINLRPSQGNRSRGVDEAKTREEIKKIVFRLVGK